jgi:hypothetical protein
MGLAHSLRLAYVETLSSRLPVWAEHHLELMQTDGQRNGTGAGKGRGVGVVATEGREL